MAGENQVEFDENTTDPIALFAQFEKMEKGDVIETPATEAVIEAPAAAGVPVVVDPPKAAEQELQDKTDPEGIATKDGKNVIPYSVLRNERERATRAEQSLKDMQQQVSDLEAKVKAGTGVPGEPAVTTQPVEQPMSDEEMETLKADFPTVYKGLMATMAQAAKLEAQLKPVQESAEQAQRESARTQAELVQDAIDNMPKLAHIAAQDPAAFELAKGFDNMLKGQAAWADKPLSERFAKVVELVENTRGAIEIPGVKVAPPAQTAEQLKAEAQKLALASAKQDKSIVPTSLSQFPAGRAPAEDEAGAVESMSQLELADKMSRMSGDQLDAYLRNL
jgi:hypothetical protein